MFYAIKTKKCDEKKLWSLKDLPLVSFVCRRINAPAAAHNEGLVEKTFFTQIL